MPRDDRGYHYDQIEELALRFVAISKVMRMRHLPLAIICEASQTEDRLVAEIAEISRTAMRCRDFVTDCEAKSNPEYAA